MPEKISFYKSPEGESQYWAAYDEALRLWPVPHESFDVTTPYGKTHINTCGPQEAFPLVLLHGGYASSTMWFPNVADLSREFRVLALDTIGEPGRSLPTRPNATKRDCAAWLETVFDALGISKAHVVGLSRGGWLALNFALYAPDRLERIALLSPAASFIELNAFFRMVVAAAMRIPARPVAKAALHSWVTPGFLVKPEFEKQFILGLMNWNWAAQANGYSGVMPSAFNNDELHQIHHPVLLLLGDQDRLNPPSTIERARQGIPQIEARLIPKAGHLLSMEQPELVDRYILQFLMAAGRPEHAQTDLVTISTL
jgi:pimeloyl-ACP methyl ester carboxylesterase